MACRLADDLRMTPNPINPAPHRIALGTTGLHVSPIGFGAFKIGRNVGTKYAESYALPDDDDVGALLHGVIDLGINLIDTAPAYGTSESRIGATLAGRRDEYVLCSKAGERYTDGTSTYDFSGPAIRRSVEESLRRLRTDVIDLLLIHSDGRDRFILEETDAVATLLALRSAGHVRAVGFSGKTVGGAHAAMSWADALMVEYHLDDRSHESVIDEAYERGIGVLVKKGLASGRLPAEDAIRFVLERPGVTSLVIGGLNLAHLAENLRVATDARR